MLRTWLGLALGIPAIALVGIAPWLWHVYPLLGAAIVSPFARDPNHWRVMVLYHGVWIAPVAVWGAMMGLRRRGVTHHVPTITDLTQQAVILAVGWLALILDFSTLGIVERVVPWLVAPLLRYDYPFSIAWHGPIIPYTILGGIGLHWIWVRWLEARVGARAGRYAYAIIGALMVLALGVFVFNRELLAFSKGRVGFFGAFASHADVQAMEWLRENAPPDARILNFPGPQEGDWVAVIAQRDSVYYRMQPFFQGAEASLEEQDLLRAFWEDPAKPDHAALLEAAGIDYVIVPQVVTNPASSETMFRWRAPFTEALAMRSRVEDAPYLRLVFDADGARVYEYGGE
jgi:hypothetical protein